MKKGFTLIELLAVIVIITMLMILTYAEFAKEIKTAKQKSYERQVVTIENAAKDYHLTHVDEVGVLINTLGDSGFISPSDLIDPRTKEAMQGCVTFEDNSYGQVEYNYIDDITQCTGIYLVRGYLSTNLVLHYDAKNNGGYGIKSDGVTWYDLSENNNAGLLQNFGSTASSGWQSDSLAFDGVDDDVFLASKLINILKTNNTLEIVIKFNDSSRSIIFGNFNDSPSTNYERTTTNKYRIYWNNGIVDAYNTVASNNSTKYLLSIVNDKANNTIKLYINGVLDSTFTNASFASTTLDWNNAYIGRDYRTGETALNGNVYSFRAYSEKLTVDQILRNYSIDKALYGV